MQLDKSFTKYRILGYVSEISSVVNEYSSTAVSLVNFRR